MSKKNTLGKSERLKSRKSIEQLFAEGNNLVVSPYKVLYMFTASSSKPGLSFGTGVSVKNFKRSVDRNKIKRLTREAYRLQKKSLQEKIAGKNIGLNVFFIYTGKAVPEYSEVYKKVGSVLSKLNKIGGG